MKNRLSVVGAALAAAILPLGLGAQDLSSPKCAAGSPGSITQIGQDACQQAYDIYQLIAPQLGLALAGGNATAGAGSVLGGLGHFSLGIRANVFSGLLPDSVLTPGTTGAQKRTLPTKSQAFGLPTADAALGLFQGFPLGLTNVFGVDALVSAEYVPTISNDNFSLDPSSNFQVGFGARIGLLSESIAFPGVSFTWIERDLPTINVTATSGVNDAASLAITNMKVTTQAWRIVASKSLIAFSVAAGVGRDAYKQNARLRGTATQSGLRGSESFDADQTLNRTNMFADLSLNLPMLKIVAEIGNAMGGTVATYNSFSGGRADRSQLYGSLGLRLSR